MAAASQNRGNRGSYKGISASDAHHDEILHILSAYHEIGHDHYLALKRSDKGFSCFLCRKEFLPENPQGPENDEKTHKIEAPHANAQFKCKQLKCPFVACTACIAAEVSLRSSQGPIIHLGSLNSTLILRKGAEEFSCQQCNHKVSKESPVFESFSDPIVRLCAPCVARKSSEVPNVVKKFDYSFKRSDPHYYSSFHRHPLRLWNSQPTGKFYQCGLCLEAISQMNSLEQNRVSQEQEDDYTARFYCPLCSYSICPSCAAKEFSDSTRAGKIIPFLIQSSNHKGHNKDDKAGISLVSHVEGAGHYYCNSCRKSKKSPLFYCSAPLQSTEGSTICGFEICFSCVLSGCKKQRTLDDLFLHCLNEEERQFECSKQLLLDDQEYEKILQPWLNNHYRLLSIPELSIEKKAGLEEEKKTPAVEETKEKMAEPSLEDFFKGFREWKEKTDSNNGNDGERKEFQQRKEEEKHEESTVKSDIPSSPSEASHHSGYRIIKEFDGISRLLSLSNDQCRSFFLNLSELPGVSNEELQKNPFLYIEASYRRSEQDEYHSDSIPSPKYPKFNYRAGLKVLLNSHSSEESDQGDFGSKYSQIDHITSKEWCKIRLIFSWYEVARSGFLQSLQIVQTFTKGIILGEVRIFIEKISAELPKRTVATQAKENSSLKLENGGEIGNAGGSLPRPSAALSQDSSIIVPMQDDFVSETSDFVNQEYLILSCASQLPIGVDMNSFPSSPIEKSSFLPKVTLKPLSLTDKGIRWKFFPIRKQPGLFFLQNSDKIHYYLSINESSVEFQTPPAPVKSSRFPSFQEFLEDVQSFPLKRSIKSEEIPMVRILSVGKSSKFSQPEKCFTPIPIKNFTHRVVKPKTKSLKHWNSIDCSMDDEGRTFYQKGFNKNSTTTGLEMGEGEELAASITSEHYKTPFCLGSIDKPHAALIIPPQYSENLSPVSVEFSSKDFYSELALFVCATHCDLDIFVEILFDDDSQYRYENFFTVSNWLSRVNFAIEAGGFYCVDNGTWSFDKENPRIYEIRLKGIPNYSKIKAVRFSPCRYYSEGRCWLFAISGIPAESADKPTFSSNHTFSILNAKSSRCLYDFGSREVDSSLNSAIFEGLEENQMFKIVPFPSEARFPPVKQSVYGEEYYNSNKEFEGLCHQLDPKPTFPCLNEQGKDEHDQENQKKLGKSYNPNENFSLTILNTNDLASDGISILVNGRYLVSRLADEILLKITNSEYQDNRHSVLEKLFDQTKKALSAREESSNEDDIELSKKRRITNRDIDLSMKSFAEENNPLLRPLLMMNGEILDENRPLPYYSINRKSILYYILRSPHTRPQHSIAIHRNSSDSSMGIYIRSRETDNLIRINVQPNMKISAIVEKSVEKCHSDRKLLKFATQQFGLIFYGRILLGNSTIGEEFIKPGDVLVLIRLKHEAGRQSDDPRLDERYNNGAEGLFFGDIKVPRDTRYDLLAFHEQIRQDVDSIIFDPRNSERFRRFFLFIDINHSGTVAPREFSLGIYTIFKLIQRTEDFGRFVKLRYPLIDYQDDEAIGLNFPLILPVSKSLDFHEFLCLLADILLEFIRDQQYNLYLRPAKLKSSATALSTAAIETSGSLVIPSAGRNSDLPRSGETHEAAGVPDVVESSSLFDPVLIGQTFSSNQVRGEIWDFLQRSVRQVTTFELRIWEKPTIAWYAGIFLFLYSIFQYGFELLIFPYTMFQDLFLYRRRYMNFLNAEKLKLFVHWVEFSILYYIPLISVIIYHIYQNSTNTDVSFLESWIPLILFLFLLTVYWRKRIVEIATKTIDIDRSLLKKTWKSSRLLHLELHSNPIGLMKVDHSKQRKSGNRGDSKSPIVSGPKDNQSNIVQELSQQKVLRQPARHERINLSHSILKHETIGENISMKTLLFIMIVSIIQALLPGVVRSLTPDSSFIGNDEKDHFISIFYILTGYFVSAFFLVILTKTLFQLINIKQSLNNVYNVADSRVSAEYKIPWYFDIRLPNNLEYWLALREEAKGENGSLTVIIGTTLIFDLSLIISSFVRVIFFKRGVDLFTVICVFDILLLSAFLLSFLILLVQINTIILKNHLELVQRTHHEMAIEEIGEGWGETAKTVEKTSFIDTWAECDIFNMEEKNPVAVENPDKRLEEMRNFKLKAQLLASAIKHMQTLDEPVKILGLVVDEALVIKALVAMATGAASSLASIIQSQK